MATIRASVNAQSKALSDAAAEILAQPKVPERRYVPLSSAEAVLRYAGDFIPSWAGAIAIDLLPAVLVGVLAVVHSAARRDEEQLTDADRVTAADILQALELNRAFQQKYREGLPLVGAEQADPSNRLDEEAELLARLVDAAANQQSSPAASRPAENVTPLTVGKRADT